MKPVCVKCHTFMRIKKSGFYFIEGKPRGGHSRPQPGLVEPESWEPYKLWAADLWECQSCGTQVLSGFGESPISEHYKPEFKAKVVEYRAEYQVNDC